MLIEFFRSEKVILISGLTGFCFARENTEDLINYFLAAYNFDFHRFGQN